MLRQSFVLLAVIFCGTGGAWGDTIQLKDKAAISGKILAEKRDQIAVDIGYTVLVIPRSSVAKISRTDAPEPAAPPLVAAKPVPATSEEFKPAAETKSGFYSSPTKSGPVRNVRDLVNLI